MSSGRKTVRRKKARFASAEAGFGYSGQQRGIGYRTGWRPVRDAFRF